MLGFSTGQGAPKQKLQRYGNEWQIEDVILEQYTGIEDKNGVNICEGDIVTNLSGLKWVVSWDEVDARFHLLYADASCGCCRMNKDWVLETEIEVIGNIHDNPELLEAHNA